MRIVAALGGSTLLRRGGKPDAGIQLELVHAAAQALAPLAAQHELVVCHGNGQQIGLLAPESQADAAPARSYPLDAVVAQTQGIVGYWLAQSLLNAGVAKPVISLVTQTLVDPADPAFTDPTAFVGPAYNRRRAHQLAERYNWTIALDGEQWRRVVASPDPLRIVEQDTITRLLGARTVPICGGGAPVIDDGTGQLHGVEAVIDKDLSAALLAIAVRADRLLVLTDVPAVMQHFGTPKATALPQLDLDELTHLRFPAGSMSPKIEACRRFVAVTGQPAAIGALADATAILDGAAGTTITPARTHDGAPARQRNAPHRHHARVEPDHGNAVPSTLARRR